MSFSLLQKDLFKGSWGLCQIFLKQNYFHACHTRFAVFLSVLMRKFTIDSSTVMIRFSPLLPLSAPFLISAPIPLGTPIPISAPILLQVKNKVFAIFPMRDIRKNVLFKFIKLFRLCGDTTLVFFWGAQIWPPKTKRKICFLGFPTNTWVHR